MAQNFLNRRPCLSLSLLCVVAGIVLPAPVQAHPRDELSQTTYIGVTRKHVGIELYLSPGDMIASDFTQLIKTNKDGILSESEQIAYSGQVCQHLSLSMDNMPLVLRYKRGEFPERTALQRGEQGVRLFFDASLSSSSLSKGKHIIRYANNYAPLSTTKNGYIIATLASQDDLRIGEQTRDTLQKTMALEIIASQQGNYENYIVFSVFGVFLILWCLRVGMRLKKRAE